MAGDPRRRRQWFDPALIGLLGVLLLVSGLALTFLGAAQTGVSWDETYHAQQLTNLHERGHLLDDSKFDPDTNAPGTWSGNEWVYGPVAESLIEASGAIVAGHPPRSTQWTSTEVVGRHLGIALLGMLGVVATVGLGRLIAGAWRWGLLAGGILACLPMWTGHSMMNGKDIPVASGYTLVSLGLVVCLRAGPRRWWGVALAVLGGVLMVGTRIGMWPGLVMSAGVAVTVSAWFLGRSRAASVVARPQTYVLAVTAIAGFGLLGVFAAYPQLLQHPLEGLTESVTRSSRFRGGGQSDRFYIPVHVLVEVPLLWLTVALVGIAAAARRWSDSRSSWQVEHFALVIVAAQMLCLPAMIIMRGSDLYNGLRHVLFAAPPFAIFAMYGVRRVHAAVKHRTLFSRLFAGTAYLSAGSVLVAQLLLFPYNYTFVNLVPALAGVTAETDYWRTSARELAVDLPRGATVVCSPRVVDRVAQRWSFDGALDCADWRLGPLGPFGRTRAPLTREPSETFYAVFERYDTLPDNCERVTKVTRIRVPSRVVMGSLSRCRLPFPEMGSEGLTLSDDPSTWQMLEAGWFLPERGSPTRAAGRRASFAVRLPAGSASWKQLHLDVSAHAGGEVSINDRVRRVFSSGDRSVNLPISTFKPGGVLHVTFVSRGHDLRLVLQALRPSS